MDADWQGTASHSFQEMWLQWHNGARQVQQALMGISQMAGKAGQVYQQTEDQLATQLRG